MPLMSKTTTVSAITFRKMLYLPNPVHVVCIRKFVLGINVEQQVFHHAYICIARPGSLLMKYQCAVELLPAMHSFV